MDISIIYTVRIAITVSVILMTGGEEVYEGYLIVVFAMEIFFFHEVVLGGISSFLYTIAHYYLYYILDYLIGRLNNANFNKGQTQD